MRFLCYQIGDDQITISWNQWQGYELFTPNKEKWIVTSDYYFAKKWLEKNNFDTGLFETLRNATHTN